MNQFPLFLSKCDTSLQGSQSVIFILRHVCTSMKTIKEIQIVSHTLIRLSYQHQVRTFKEKETQMICPAGFEKKK